MRPLTHPIVMTEFDRRRLGGLLQLMRARSSVDATSLDALERELARAQVVPVASMPPSVVTMNSRVTLIDADSHHTTSVSLVFPDGRATDGTRVAVLSPLGLALLGCREGDELVWQTADGTRRLRLQHVTYQPEAAGDALL